MRAGQAGAQLAAARAAQPPVERSSGKVVMVVDDSILSREAMSKVLTSSGYSVIATKDGQEAWDRINVFLAEARRQGRPIQELLPLAIVDIEMPQMDGFSLTRLIKENPELQGLKVVLHTSLGGPENIYKGYKMGADEFLVKFNPKLLLELARKFTG
jgi:two-component system chemotaxis response regulator CheV